MSEPLIFPHCALTPFASPRLASSWFLCTSWLCSFFGFRCVLLLPVGLSFGRFYCSFEQAVCLFFNKVSGKELIAFRVESFMFLRGQGWDWEWGLGVCVGDWRPPWNCVQYANDPARMARIWGRNQSFVWHIKPQLAINLA